jgi:hypothetical protein
LKLGDLAQELIIHIAEIRNISILSQKPISPPYREAKLAAIMFEAGRECGVKQAIEMLHSVVTKPNKATAQIANEADQPSKLTLAGTPRVM